MAQIERALRERGYTEPIFFAQKILDRTDLSISHKRLLIEVEANNPIIATLDGIIGGIHEVRLMHSLQSLESSPITLERYTEGGASSSYVLRNGWHDVAVNQIGLRPNQRQKVRLWLCRRPGNNIFYVFVHH
jgi:hypothetical protein